MPDTKQPICGVAGSKRSPTAFSMVATSSAPYMHVNLTIQRHDRTVHTHTVTPACTVAVYAISQSPTGTCAEVRGTRGCELTDDGLPYSCRTPVLLRL